MFSSVAKAEQFIGTEKKLGVEVETYEILEYDYDDLFDLLNDFIYQDNLSMCVAINPESLTPLKQMRTVSISKIFAAFTEYYRMQTPWIFAESTVQTMSTRLPAEIKKEILALHGTNSQCQFE